MIQINITGADASVTQTETLTAGRVGLECSFSFDSAWDGLSKIAVCEGADTRSVVMDSDTIIVPWECLADPGYKLRVGVRGENSSGDIVIPTVWARVGKIVDSPGDDIDPGQEATPSVVQQIQEAAANALYIARGVKAEADSGAFNGKDGEDGADGADGAPGPQGPTGPQGDPGVYIGSTEPTDPDISVWIDTSGDADQPAIPEKATVLPSDLGTAAIGSSEKYAAEDHVHKMPTASDVGALPSSTTIPTKVSDLTNDSGFTTHGVPSGGSSGYVLKKASGTDYDLTWAAESGGSSITVDSSLSDSSENPVQNKVIKSALDAKGTYSKPSGGIPDTDIASASTWNAKGSYSKPSGGIPASDLASAVQTSLGKADTALQSFTETDPTVPSWAKASSKPSYTASEVGAAPAVAEVTVSDTGSVSQALDAGKIYHFTGAITALTITLNSPASGQLAQYHFDFNSGSTAATLTMPNTVTMPDSFAPEASKHYEVDVLNNYGAVVAWATS